MTRGSYYSGWIVSGIVCTDLSGSSPLLTYVGIVLRLTDGTSYGFAGKIYGPAQIGSNSSSVWKVNRYSSVSFMRSPSSDSYWSRYS